MRLPSLVRGIRFLDGLAELGIDKGLIKNKKLLSDLIEKEKGYRNVEKPSDNESTNEESSSDIENQEEEEEVPSENGVEAEGTQESDNDTENDSQETESSSPETSTTFHSKSPCEHCENSNESQAEKKGNIPLQPPTNHGT